MGKQKSGEQDKVQILQKDRLFKTATITKLENDWIVINTKELSNIPETHVQLFTLPSGWNVIHIIVVQMIKTKGKYTKLTKSKMTQLKFGKL